MGRLLAGFALILALASGLAPGAQADETPRIALVVGNKDYQMTGWQLSNTSADAELVANSLESVGFDVTLLLDADKAAFENAIRLYGRKLSDAGREAVGVFYFAGHGAQADGLNFLLPIDAAPQVEADLYTMAPRLDTLTRQLKSAGNRTNFVILDACRNNPLPASSRSTGGGLAKVETAEARGLLIAYSTAPGKTASDGLGGTNSPFAQALTEFLTEPGLSAEQLFKRVAGRVEELTSDAQQPWMESGLRGADFCFAGCAPRVALTDPADLEFWTGVKDSTDATLLQSYVDAFPDGRFVPLAQAKLANLSSPGGPGGPSVPGGVTPPGAANGVATPPSSAAGASTVSDDDRLSALTAINLGWSGAGGVTFTSSEREGADQVLRGARLALLDAGGAFDVGAIRVVNPRLDAGEAAFDALILSQVSVDAVDNEGTFTVDEVRLETPNPATVRFVAALFSGDALGAAGFASVFSDYAFGQWRLTGLRLNVTGYSRFNLAVNAMSVGGVEGGDVDVFDVSGVVYDGGEEGGQSFSGRLDRLAINGFRGRILDALAELSSNDGVKRAAAMSTLVGAGGFSDPYAKRFDSIVIKNATFEMDGVRGALAELTSEVEDTRDGVIQRAAFNGLKVGFDSSGTLGVQALQLLSEVGQTEFEFSLVSEYSGDPFEDRLFVREFTLAMKDGFTLDLAYDLIGLRRFTNLMSEAQLKSEAYYNAYYGGDEAQAAAADDALLREAQALEAEAQTVFVLRRAQAKLVDQSLVHKALAIAAAGQGVSLEAMREEVIARLRESVQTQATPSAEGMIKPMIDAVESFIRTPGELVVRLKPNAPVSAVALNEAAQDVAAVITLLGVEVEAKVAP